MTAGRWERVKSAFESARSMSGSDRQRYIDSLAQSDPEILEELRQLLHAYEESESFLATGHMQGSIQGDLAAAGLTSIGRRLGAFQLAQLIGVGGMGEVYRGERVDGEFQQSVAIKVIRQATDAFSVARFRVERQILATLSHPNIARIYDGGTTESGEPYFVMEYIEGERIDEYCKLHGLSDAQSLRLLITICGAVHYAHQHNVIHRDLKPANIMVGKDGAPRLLDFGIAKLLAAPDPSPNTATRTHALTPDYASPEQLLNRPVTAASDVFSLGAIMHELLSGIRFRAAASPNEPGRRIAPQYARVIRKATAAEPADRYATAEELARAIEESLKPAWRMRRSAAVAGCVLAALLAGLLWWRWQASLAQKGGSIAVIEIENLSQDPSLDWMDRGIAELLTTGLAQSEKFEVISTERIRNLMGRRIKGDGKFPAAMVREVAAEAHARSFVSGALMRVGQRLRLDVKVQDTATGRVLFARHTEGDSAQALFQMADETASMVIQQIGGPLDKKPASGQALTDNVEALKAYTEGMRLLDRFLIGRAVQSFETAIRLDPRFAMAHYRIALALFWWEWQKCLAETRQAANMAENLSLPYGQKLRIRMLGEVCGGQTAQARADAQALTSENPHDVEGWVMLANASFDDGDAAQAWTALERGLAVDPTNAPLLGTGWWFSAFSGDFARTMQFADRYQATLEPGDVNGIDTKGDGFAMFGHWDEAMAAYQQEDRFDKMGFVALRQGNYDLAALLFRRDLEKLPPNSVGRGGRMGFLGDVEVARGDLERALPYFEEGARLYGRQFWFGADVMLKAALVYLEEGTPAKVADLADHQSNPWRAGFRGMADLLLGRAGPADVEFAALRTSISQILGDLRAEQYEKLYRGIAASYGGRPAEAIELLSSLPFIYRTHTALPLGRAYLQRGDLAAAERELNFALKAQSVWALPTWYERQNMLALLMTHYYLGELSEKLGRRAEAANHYREFYRHFEHSNAKLPQMAAARAALQRLSAPTAGK